MKLFNIITVNDRNICTKGVGKLFYEQGFPLSQTADILKEKGVEISWFNVIDEFWNNGWSWETIEMKLIGEQGLDILGSMKNIDFSVLKQFYDCLEQPKRSNGGWEESREMIFQYLFQTSSNEIINNIKNGDKNFSNNVIYESR